ncbi:MAG: rhomboid family intramembrane serine protease [Acidobacteria bacterium]|nr:rhomboid family intramembrane serine protease [Acidobacteriota bacterium]
MNFWKTPVTAALLAAILFVFVLELLAGALRDMQVLEQMGAIVRGVIERGDYWRLLAAMFLHGGFIHLLLNMWALLQIGGIFETLFGSTRFLLTYFISGLAASLVSSIFIPPNTPGVGASGAIFGIIGALIVALRRSPQWSRKEWSGALARQLAMWAGINIIIGFTMPGIDNAAHIGGFIAGLILGLVPHHVPPPPPNELTIDVQVLDDSRTRQ